jgi:NAD+ synthase (glutamine-hydrolysing)
MPLRIALAQTNVTVGDLDGNRRRIVENASRAREAGAELVLFPELALCGYPPEDLLFRRRFLHDCRSALDALADETTADGAVAALVGFPDRTNDGVCNALALLRGGRVCDIYHKIELPNYGVFDEARYFDPGVGGVEIEVSGVPLGLTVCEDIWIRDGGPERNVGSGRARVVLNASASPFHAGKVAERREIVVGFARRTGAFVCYCNLVGGQDELVFDGGSLAVDSRGTVVAEAERFREDLVLVDVDADGAGRAVERRPVRALDAVDEVHEALVLGTRDYVHKNGFHDAVIGLSGGIDSAVAAAVAVDALGAQHVVNVTMPSQYTSSETRSDAERLAANLGTRLITSAIKAIYETYEAALAEHLGPEGSRDAAADVATENLQARIRGNLLMALSNRYGWIVLTTGNKSETATGYCTLYGDMAGGFAVIKDCPKTLVYRLAERFNRVAGREVIPQSILDRAPSAELRPDQKDSDSLPPYPVLDPILRMYVEEDRSAEDIVAAGFDPEVVARTIRLVFRSEYKRRQAPPGVKITPKAFGRDRRLPITNRYA